MYIGSDLKDIRVKAGNPDDELEVRSIIKLFAAAYGQGFPAKEVYNTQFWSRRIGTRFSSLLAISRNKVVGHLALQPDREARRNVQITFPAVDPSYQPFAVELAQLAWAVINKQAERQQWRSMYMKMIADGRTYQGIAAKIFGMTETAIFPGYFQTVDENGSRRADAVVVQRVFDTSPIGNGSGETLYAPRKHADICAYLYAGAGVARKFQTESRNGQHVVPADRRACECRRFPGQGFSHVSVYPSLLDRFAEAAPHLRSPISNLFFVSMQDPRCPAFCQYLEDNGFCFCGVLPLLKNRESIVYCRTNGWPCNDTVWGSDRARVLAQYIQNGRPAVPEFVLNAEPPLPLPDYTDDLLQ